MRLIRHSPSIAIVDFGTGNLNSVKRALGRLGVRFQISASADELTWADKIVIPGVGHFARAMVELERRGLQDALDEAVLTKRKPVLGICLGMELMARRSEEGDPEGLGWLDAKAVRFQFNDWQSFKVPHMGWNTVSAKKDSILFKDIDDTAEFYFAHSYYLKLNKKSDEAAETSYETIFPSAIERGNIFGVQFHPEKSHAAGLKILRNFAAF